MRITKEQIDECFEGCESQREYVINIYKLVFPQWDDIKQVKGWPKAGKGVDSYIWEKAMAWDKENILAHENVMAGGLWMNNGFSRDETLDDWEFQPCEVELNEG